jgi:hypothetical protein
VSRCSEEQCYSITSSARASSVGGTSRPSAFAVLRLSTRSYLVGACTGKSAGFSPLRIGDVPELDIEFIDSTEVPVGLGEPATTVVAPAIGNAIFAAVGARLRHLPIRPAVLRKALAGHSGAQ